MVPHAHSPWAVVGDADKIVEAITAWAESMQAGNADAADANPAELGKLVEELLERETSYAEQNAKRLRLVTEAFARDDFETKVTVVDFLLRPLDAVINKMLRRTSVLKELRFMGVKSSSPAQNETTRKLKDYTQSAFLSWTSGALGCEAIASFLANLGSVDMATYCQRLPGEAISLTCFQLTVFAVSDTWRRFCFAVDSYPWKMFSLATCSRSEFTDAWSKHRAVLARCSKCVDAGFSAPLLRAHDLSAVGVDQRDACIQEIQSILLQIATFSPLASDTVENLHGQHQGKLFVWRARARGSPAASEISVLTTMAAEHGHLKALLLNETMPTKLQMAQMQRGLGRKRDAEVPLQSCKKRLAAATTRDTPRRLSPWNVYFREQLQGLGRALSKQEYDSFSKQCGQHWKHVSQEERARYAVQASYEQTCRDELQTRGLRSADAENQGTGRGVRSELQATPADSLPTLELEEVAGHAVDMVFGILSCQLFVSTGTGPQTARH